MLDPLRGRMSRIFWRGVGCLVNINQLEIWEHEKKNNAPLKCLDGSRTLSVGSTTTTFSSSISPLLSPATLPGSGAPSESGGTTSESFARQNVSGLKSDNRKVSSLRYSVERIIIVPNKMRNAKMKREDLRDGLETEEVPYRVSMCFIS